MSAAVLAASLAIACSVNPATGKRQINLIGQGQEVQMGKEADQEIVRTMGLYDDPEMTAYVEQLGRRLAKDSERPDLNWHFRVVDDPAVNAFALPGGYVYVTRGILTHLTSEAELAGVMGHEIGHVAARHSVNQVSKAQIAQLGLGLGMILSPQLRQYGQAAGMGLSLLFLKYSRDDERQADELGLRYMRRENYDPRQLVKVFQMLEDVSNQEGSSSRLPNWLSTHPAPENRQEMIRSELKGKEGREGIVNRSEYLTHVDGMVYGDDPRQGYFKDGRFIQPELEFQFDFPRGWNTMNQRAAVMAVSSQKDAAMEITVAGTRSAAEAERKFFDQQGIRAGRDWGRDVNGLPTEGALFEANTEQGRVVGLATFIEYGNRVYQVLGYAPAQAWDQRSDEVQDAIHSFRPVEDPRLLRVEPMRVRVIETRGGETLQTVARQSDNSVNVKTLSLLNQVDPSEPLPSGELVKLVVGERSSG